MLWHVVSGEWTCPVLTILTVLDRNWERVLMKFIHSKIPQQWTLFCGKWTRFFPRTSMLSGESMLPGYGVTSRSLSCSTGFVKF